jgi:uncharacterized membrane protein
MRPESENERHWKNPDHWAGPAMLSVYFCKSDTRTWVPKRIPALGWTLNLGRTAGVVWLAVILVALPLIAVAVARLAGPG